MVEVRGYVRSGNTLFWQLPNGRFARVRSGVRMQTYLNKLVLRDQKLKKIQEKYENQPRFSGQRIGGKCAEAASDVVKALTKLGFPVEVHNFLVNGQSNHVIAFSEGKYYDFTGKQYGNNNLVFDENELPKNYVFRGKISVNHYL